MMDNGSYRRFDAWRAAQTRKGDRLLGPNGEAENAASNGALEASRLLDCEAERE